MISVTVFKDGSALKTWVSRGGEHSTSRALLPDEVRELVSMPCINAPGGCGLCLSCVTKAAWRDRM